MTRSRNLNHFRFKVGDEVKFKAETLESPCPSGCVITASGWQLVCWALGSTNSTIIFHDKFIQPSYKWERLNKNDDYGWTFRVLSCQKGYTVKYTWGRADVLTRTGFVNEISLLDLFLGRKTRSQKGARIIHLKYCWNNGLIAMEGVYRHKTKQYIFRVKGISSTRCWVSYVLHNNDVNTNNVNNALSELKAMVLRAKRD